MSFDVKKITKKIADFISNKTVQLILVSIERLIGIIIKLKDLI